MDLRELLKRLAQGRLGLDEAERMIKLWAIKKIEHVACADISREIRRGVPEIILAEGKQLEDLKLLIRAFVETNGRAIVSRLNRSFYERLQPFLQNFKNVTHYYNERARILVVKKPGYTVSPGGRVGIIAAGTSDIPIAEEVKVISEEMGCTVFVEYDVGIANLMRALTAVRKMIEKDVDVIVVVAGREAALASLVASLTDIPVIGVPCSSGYGFGGGGLSALMSMLQSCPLGMTVVNIDNGIGAGVAAAMIARRIARYREAQESGP